MSWINVLWQDPEEGQAYDVWVSDGLFPGRNINCRFIGGEWYSQENSFTDLSLTRSWLPVSGKVTHFMPSPEKPKD